MKDQTAPTQLPETGFIRQPQLLALIPFSQSTLKTRIKQGAFPAPVKISPRVNAWKVETIREYINQAA